MVSFQWRDRRENNALKAIDLSVELFMKRFLLHVLPEGFVRIRHYGFLGNPNKKRIIALCRDLLGESQNDESENNIPKTWQEIMIFLTGKDPTVCPECGNGRLFLFEKIKPEKIMYKNRTG